MSDRYNDYRLGQSPSSSSSSSSSSGPEGGQSLDDWYNQNFGTPRPEYEVQVDKWFQENFSVAPRPEHEVHEVQVDQWFQEHFIGLPETRPPTRSKNRSSPRFTVRGRPGVRIDRVFTGEATIDQAEEPIAECLRQYTNVTVRIKFPNQPKHEFVMNTWHAKRGCINKCEALQMGQLVAKTASEFAIYADSLPFTSQDVFYLRGFDTHHNVITAIVERR